MIQSKLQIHGLNGLDITLRNQIKTSKIYNLFIFFKANLSEDNRKKIKKIIIRLIIIRKSLFNCISIV